MKIIFFGSSEFSIAALEACRQSSHEVALVLTTPDKKKGRGLKETATPVKQYCDRHQIRVETPESTKDPVWLNRIKDLQPDIFVVSSYGKMIPSSWLGLPLRARLNVHPSLLPKYRGAAPINWPILLGDPATGISIIDITDKLDSGDIFYQKEIPLNDQINAGELAITLAKLSEIALREVFEKIDKGTLPCRPQKEEESSYARKLRKSDGQIDWSKSAVELHRMIRGLLPWPTAYFELGDEPIQILKSHVADAEKTGQPGMLLEISKQGWLLIQTGRGVLAAERVHPAGKKEMSAADFARGRRFEAGHSFARP